MQLKYQTVDAVLYALRPEARAFRTPEAQFLLNIVSAQNRLTQSDQLKSLSVPEMSWSQLERCDFALAFLWQNLRNLRADAVPQKFIDICKSYSRKILMMNELRVHTITRLSQAASKAGVDLVFIKGAAEICQFYTDVNYLSQRSMGDLDLICAQHDLPAIDAIMKDFGYHLSDYGASFVSEEALRIFSLEHVGHYMYASDTESATGSVEVHIAPAVGRALRAYPVDFAHQLLIQSRSIRVGPITVRIPSKEHMVVYNICHAAGAKDHWVLSAMDQSHFDQCFSTAALSSIELVNARLDASQLEFLFRLRNMLTAMGADLNRNEIVRLLASVNHRRLLTMYLELAQTFLPDLCDFLGPTQNLSVINRRRNGFLLRNSVAQHPVARKTKYGLHQILSALRRLHRSPSLQFPSIPLASPSRPSSFSSPSSFR